MRLVDADELIVMGFDITDCENQLRFVPYEFIEEAPTVDAEPVRHGRWNKSCRCSECDGWGLTYTDAVSGQYKYCPNCGARMGGGGVDFGNV